MQFPFKKQMRVEVVDKTHLCRTRVALVEQVGYDGLRLDSHLPLLLKSGSVMVLVVGRHRSHGDSNDDS